MFIESEPKDKVYRDLIDLAFDICDEFLLVVRNDLFFNQNVDYLLEKLKPSLIKTKDVYQWPGTILAGGKPAKIYYYKADNNVKTTIKIATNSLYSWVQPDLPEDLSFIKNGEYWLVTTSHEFESYINTDDKEEILKISNIIQRG